MSDLNMNPEMMERAEQIQSPEQLNQMQEMYLENLQEAQRAGNEDMAKYYQEKLDAMEEQALDSDNSRMGGWHAGYTDAEWRRKADEEYGKNGNSSQYRKYISNAQKAEG